MIRDWMSPRPGMRELAAAFAVRHGLTLDDLQGRARDEYTATVRRGAMLEIHLKTKFSTPQIGRFFNRDHTTVLYAIRRAKGETPVQAKSPRDLVQQEAA